jgi:predicted secreted protein
LSEGYSWTLSSDPLTALQFTGGPTNMTDVGMPGSSERQQFTFTAVASGQNNVVLTYAQAKAAPVQTYTITAVVS